MTNQPLHLFCEKPQSLRLKGFPNLSQTRKKDFQVSIWKEHLYDYNRISNRVFSFKYPLPLVKPSVSTCKLNTEGLTIYLRFKNLKISAIFFVYQINLQRLICTLFQFYSILSTEFIQQVDLVNSFLGIAYKQIYVILSYIQAAVSQ